MGKFTVSYLIIKIFFLILISSSILYSSDIDIENIKKKIDKLILGENHYIFFGLASFYNNTNYYVVKKNSIEKIEINSKITLKENEWLAIVERLNVILIKESDLMLELTDSNFNIDSQLPLTKRNTIIKMVSKSELSSVAPELDKIRYFHLWGPLAWLAKVIESGLVLIQTYLVSNWGLVIIVFAVLLKLLLLPVGIATIRFQRKVSQVQSSLAPKLAEIKANYNGEEAHNRLMAAHKELGVSPFFTLKPMLGSFIQVPILIATFNVLGEMPQFDGQSFLWIENLAYPDSIMHLTFSVPMFGDTINLLPFLMIIITIYSTMLFQNKHAPDAEVKRQKRNLYFMAFLFFVLFYPFPAVMVFYWVLANILQLIQQKYLEI